ncbi:HugZ family pyridoxamine 5'-phosphate oxidase [Flexibacterium corallicola]|uniref:HugZ family pyridoxamine 5'-phosphate oxidase n=1 Tax=Flexibacterium corallicola TaxID=3037259 RepID=UPI00286F1AA3|nr:DUF2470 domain-containing protein [Pseudovibrio sp. M1P-2-3]
MNKKQDIIRPTDDEARRLAVDLVHTARTCSLAVQHNETGAPFVTMVGLSVDVDGAPFLLISELSVHTACLKANPNASILVGSTGKGDPLAHPRLTIMGNFEKVERDSPKHKCLKANYLSRHPKAKLYVDFGDFCFYRMKVERGHLNGGFGKAFVLKADELLDTFEHVEDFALAQRNATDHMNDDHRDANALIAQYFCKAEAADWSIAGIDRNGIDFIAKETIVRCRFDKPIEADEIKSTLIGLLREARGQD